MSAAVTLSLAQQPEHALVADCIAADRFASLGAKQIAELPVVHGGRRATLGDFFKVRGERSSTLRIEGELARVEGIGTAMAGGEIVIAGGAGWDVGVQMAGGSRGLVVVTGDVERGAGTGMIAGTVVVFGKAAAGAGRFLKRGSLVALGAIERPASFRYACTYRPPHIPVLLRYLRARYGLAVAERQITGRYARYSGDLAELGRGEILQWVAP